MSRGLLSRSRRLVPRWLSVDIASDEGARASLLEIFLIVTGALLVMLALVNVFQLVRTPSTAGLANCAVDVANTALFVLLWKANRAGYTRTAGWVYVAMSALWVAVAFPLRAFDLGLGAQSLPVVAASFLIGPAASFPVALLSISAHAVLHAVGLLTTEHGTVGYVTPFAVAFVAWIVAERLGQTMRAVREREHRFRALFEVSPDAIVLVSLEGKLLAANPRAVSLLGFESEEEILSRFPNGRELIAGRDDRRMDHAVRTLLKDGVASIDEYDALRKDGTTVPVEIGTSIIADESGAPQMIMAIARDITERKRLDQLKGDFLAMVSHELRMPLSVIIGFADAIDRWPDPVDPEARHNAARRIRERGAAMAHLIEDLMDVSQIDAGSFALRVGRVDFGKLVARAARSVPLRQRHTLVLDIPTDLPPVYCDPARISTAVTNLTENAVKFSPDGGAVRVCAGAGSESVWATVSDEGIGIAPDALERVFDRFTQVDMSATRAFGGVGMGLYLARVIAETHDGRIDVESTPGAGSTFTLTIPLRYSGK